MLENSGGSIDGCIIGQEQNSNKMHWPSPKFTPSRFESKTKEVITLLHPNTIRPTQSVRHIFLTHLRRGVSGATLKFCSPKTAA